MLQRNFRLTILSISLLSPTTQLMTMGRCLPPSPQGLPLPLSQLRSNQQLLPLLIAASGPQLPRRLDPLCMASQVAGIPVAVLTV